METETNCMLTRLLFPRRLYSMVPLQKQLLDPAGPYEIRYCCI